MSTQSHESEKPTQKPIVEVDKTPRFTLGRLLMTPGAKALLEQTGDDLMALVHRHVTGDWGDLTEDDSKANDEAVRQIARIFSAYTLKDGQSLWIITEADRSATTALLPEEY